MEGKMLKYTENIIEIVRYQYFGKKCLAHHDD